MEGLVMRQAMALVPTSSSSSSTWCGSSSAASSSYGRSGSTAARASIPPSAALSQRHRGRNGGAADPLLQKAMFSTWKIASDGAAVAGRLRSVKVQASKKVFTSFDDMINNSDIPILVDFYATWCGPCQLMVPILNDVGIALKDKVNIVKVDTEKYPNVASRYGIQALPTFVLFVDGKPINWLEGAHPKDKLIDHITQTLALGKANVSN